MKKITFVHWVLVMAVMALIAPAIESCNPKPKGKVVQPIVVQDTLSPLPIIDTTIIEDGTAPLVSDGAGMKKSDKDEKQKKEKVSCAFGLQKFNNRKRPKEEAPGGKKGKPVKPTPPPPPPDNPPPDEPPPTGSTNVIYLNFLGKDVVGTMWNTNGPLTVNSSGLAQVEIDYVVAQVRAHYADFNVTVTTNKAEFDAAAFGHKVEIIITESYEWFGQAGGVAYINSFFWTNGTPGFVFSLLLNYNSHWIGEAAAHEAGHTLGLRHQSDCSGTTVVNPYSNGKTMGVSYSSFPKGVWWTGTSSLSCQIQDDRAKITSGVGLKLTAYFKGEEFYIYTQYKK